MRYLVSLGLLCTAAFLIGCPLATDPELPPREDMDRRESLQSLVSRTLQDNLRRRRLSIQTQGAWQILHGVLAYGRDFPVDTASGSTSALQYLLDGGTLDGFNPIPGDSFGDPPRRGLRMEMQPSTKIGQGHRDQWLAIVSQCGLPLETELESSSRKFTLADWLAQAQYDVPLNLELEFSWSLIALTTYHDTEHRWLGRDGVQYSTEDLVLSEVQQNLGSSVCGGTHRLIGLAMALNQRRREGRPIQGVWQQAQALLDQSIEMAKQNQNADGSFSIAYLHRPGWTRDLGETLGTSGHVLEFLSLAASDQTLAEPWVERSVRRVCEVLEQCKDVDIECGVLYHALHGLSVYQSRMPAAKKSTTKKSTAKESTAKETAVRPLRPSDLPPSHESASDDAITMKTANPLIPWIV